MRDNRTLPTKEIMKIMKSKVQGHINYYGVRGNRRSVGYFVTEVRKLLFRWLNRRSQRKSFNLAGYVKFLQKYPLPIVQTNVMIYNLGAGVSYLT